MGLDQAIQKLELEEVTLLNALTSALGATRANIRERLQRIEEELDELYVARREEEDT